MRADESLDFRIRIPALAIYFVSANVAVGIRKELSHLGDELVEKFVGCLLCRIRHGIDAARIDGIWTPIAGELGIAYKPGAAVARGVEFRKNANTAVVCVGNQLANLVLRVVQTIRAHLVQPGKALALDSKALVVREMKVDNIHLYRRHSVKVALEHVEWNEVASNVNEQAAPGKPRLIRYRDCRHNKSFRPRFD